MSKHVTPPRNEKPEDIDPAEFMIQILGWFWNVMMAVGMFIMYLVTCGIVLFLIACGVIIFIQFIVGISNPIPFVEQF